MIHGLLFFAWMIIFLLQTLWARRRKLRLHRTLGLWSLGLAAAMVVIGYATVIEMTRRGFDLSGDLHLTEGPTDPVAQMIFPLLDITAFGLLVTAGYLFRHRPAAHKRLMLFAVVAMMPAPFAHFIGHSPVLRQFGPIVLIPIAVSLFASAAYDLARFRRVHPVSISLGLGLFILDNLSATLIGPGAAWHRFGNWLIG